VLTAWDQQLQQLFGTAVAAQQQQYNCQQQQQGQERHQPTVVQSVVQAAGQGGDTEQLQLCSFLELLQERDIIPQLLEPWDVKEVLKRLLEQRSSLVGQQLQLWPLQSCTWGHPRIGMA